jgi:regulation of enolase protein 1 (concanavalin A-like superfamily)
VYQPLTGDGSLWVRVLSVQNTSPYAKAGIMFRDGTEANAAHVILDVKPDGCAEFMKRDSTGATTTFLATGSECGLPILLRLTRTGSTFSADVSTDQVNVQHLGSTTMSLPAAVNVGLVVSSHDNSSLNTSTFDNVAFTQTPPDRALHQPVVSSSDFSPAYAAANAVDGDASTRWSSQFSEPQWIYVDFGQRMAVNEVVLSWETAYARYYQLQVSDDLMNWTTIGQVIDGDGGTDDVTGLSGTGRYLRLVCITRATEWGFSLWSLQAFGDPALSP